MVISIIEKLKHEYSLKKWIMTSLYLPYIKYYTGIIKKVLRNFKTKGSLASSYI